MSLSLPSGGVIDVTESTVLSKYISIKLNSLFLCCRLTFYH